MTHINKVRKWEPLHGTLRSWSQASSHAHAPGPSEEIQLSRLVKKSSLLSTLQSIAISNGFIFEWATIAPLLAYIRNHEQVIQMILTWYSSSEI